MIDFNHVNKSRLGLAYARYYGVSFENFLESASVHGFRHAQLTPDQSPNLISQFNNKRLRGLTELSRHLGITLHLHNVFYDINPTSVVPEVRGFALSVTERVAEFAAEVGASTLTIHPGYRFPGWRRPEQEERYWSAAADGLDAIGRMSERYPVQFMFENGSYHLATAAGSRVPLHIGIEAEELKRICELSGNRVYVSLDLGKILDSRLSIHSFIKVLGTRVRQFQFSSVPELQSDLSEMVSAINAQDFSSAVVFYEGWPDDLRPELIGLALQR